MTTTVLQTEHLTKRYGPLTAVDDLSLEVHEGEIFGFLGPNGAGKTTSINMMCGLLKPDTGRVLIHGKPVHGGAPKVRARVGVCPQETILWEKLTGLEQLEFIGSLYGIPPRTARQRGGALLEVLGLSSKANVLAGKLSGGMKRRLNLALALVHDPEILVLDEPEAGLDPQSRVLVREYIRSLARRKTVILTTHNMDEAERLADRVAIIDHGRLLVVDTPEELKRTVGEGDVLEVNIGEVSPGSSSPEPAAIIAARLFADVSTVNHTLTVRGRGLIEHLPELLQALREAGVKTSDVRLRANSLEDVFLSLTGRRLRE
jgi:ABC-2 type transport system ATP-binding protein